MTSFPPSSSSLIDKLFSRLQSKQAKLHFFLLPLAGSCAVSWSSGYRIGRVINIEPDENNREARYVSFIYH